ncbi:raftlin isoform X1 [Podarcis raffonei]|uniref:raftlin isoform X1 n=1 Tax=Podarcis raffonei TaxID=65483 RepID=UPI00232957A9|nr:raftlin isoform X1 [Podarcis raffonei]XP_053265652.1 raftlin isoform X1 [Podarcis raffonei]XP_053265653.1 raftlin isoform X1 [Podarcis raffonei]XP_053265654.1 raftlin isoform X1 [Podarcis raffonei]
MGCGLNKLEKHDEKRPGNIYSTLKRPQVETKIDIFYEYHFLEFTTLSDAELLGSSAIRLSSLRDLPAQLQELYQQGFILAAVHPFVQPANENERTPQEQIFRAVLIKKTERSLKNDAVSEGNTLEIESCFSSDHFLDKSKMPDLIKKIQDAASRGLRFVGIIPQYASEMNSKSSSAVISTSNSSRELKGDKNPSDFAEDCVSSDHEKAGCTNGCKVPAAREENLDQCVDPNEDLRGEGQVIEHLSLSSAGENGGQLQETEIFAVYNKPKALQRSSQYYSLTIPVKITSDGQSICSLEANWLEHMTDHFRKGSTLVNAIFSLGMINDSFQGMTDGVFIFEDISVEDNKSIQGYDAIVVEQWTVLEGARVQADYVPLLNSLAIYGWQLTCVLPTPVVKTNRDGNLATKQIVFLQRPLLPQKTKKKQSKFHWRFSKEDRHQKQAKKSLKAKLSAKERHQTGEMQELEVTENARNSETQFCTTQSGLQFPVISDQQLAAVEDGGTETLGHGDGPLYNNEGFAEKWNAGHNAEQDGGGLCLEQTGMHENCEGQIFQDHCTATDTDWSCGAEATETSFDAGCQFD